MSKRKSKKKEKHQAESEARPPLHLMEPIPQRNRSPR